MSDVTCPYCEAEQEICHDDGFGYEECQLHEQQCRSCEKTFVFQTSITLSYEPYKADCLNGGEHQWAITKTWPHSAARWRCADCANEKALTADEMIAHLAKESAP